MIRSFIAVEIPDDVKDDIEVLVGHFKAAGYPIRWVNRQNLHLTLVFLGENPPEFVDRARECLERVALAAPGFAVSLKGLGVFPNERSPRVVWVGFEQGAPELTSLALRIQNELVKIGFLPEPRPFSAHLTLGRVRERMPDIKPILSRSFASRSFLLKRVLLFQSTLEPTGPVYDELAAFNLQPPGG
jgi:2'-5' RNA ligase